MESPSEPTLSQVWSLLLSIADEVSLIRAEMLACDEEEDEEWMPFEPDVPLKKHKPT